MTPYEMRRQADRHRAEANVLEESARELRAAAGSIRGLLSGVAGMSRMVWQGPAASRFEQEAAEHSAGLDAAADEIDREAAGFDARALRLRTAANQLLHEAARLEAQSAKAAVGTAIPGAR